MGIYVKQYSQEDKNIWDDFVNNSKNSTFMLTRDYMDYHSDKFTDFSLMFYEDQNLIALLPASLHEQELRSHGGLTYGGLITNKKMTTPKMLEVFESMKDFLKKNNIKFLIYKRVPSIYYSYPADEDLYALFRNNASIINRNISTCIYLPDKISFNERRKRNIKKAKKASLKVIQSFDFCEYINLVNNVLEKYHNAKAVHSGEELAHLANSFPDNIKLFISTNKQNEMLAGVLIFDTSSTVHCQYIANSDEGRDVGALDLVFEYLINEYSVNKKFFDFGTSNGENGTILNNGLISQKQEFGGRGIVYDFYKLEVK